MSNLFDAVGDICRTQYNLGAAPKPAAKPDPDLTWREFDDLGDPNWSLHLGYTTDWDDGDCSCWIHRAQLNTGQQLVELDLRGIDRVKWEAELSVLEFDEAQEAAQHLNVRDKCDDGDYAFDRANEKRHERVIAGNGNASEQRELDALIRALKVQP